MDLRECYAEMQGDYEDMVRRMPNEDFIRRFLCSFPEDDSFLTLQRAMKEKDGETAFRAAHTLKGISQNLGMGELYRTALELTELLRAGKMEEALPAYEAVAQSYEKTAAAVRKLRGENE